MSVNQMNQMPPNLGNNNNGLPQQSVGNKRGRDFSYQEPMQGQQSGGMPSYMGYFPAGVPVPQSMYQQMPPSSDVQVMALPPLYVGPPMSMTVHGSQAASELNNSEGAPSKKKHTSQWALEKRRARNRVTAAESRRKSKQEAQTLREEVARLTKDLKEKNELLGEYKEKYQLYENGQSKEEVDRIVTQRRAAMAAAAAAAVVPVVSDPPPVAAPKPVVSIDPTGETARL